MNDSIIIGISKNVDKGVYLQIVVNKLSFDGIGIGINIIIIVECTDKI